MDYIIQDGELYHHGVLGQKWGVRRFQNKDGSLTQAGKKRISRKQKKALEKARKAKQAKAEAAKKAKQEQADFEANKKKALESGSAADVLKYKGKLTNQELQQVVSRLNMEQRISELADKKEPTKVEKLTKKLSNANDFVDKGITGWNNIAKILNSTTKADLPIIKEDKKKKENVAEKAKKVVEKATDAITKEQQKQQKKEAKRADKDKGGPDNAKVDSKPADSKPAATKADAPKIKYTLKRNVSDLARATWVQKESDKILNEIKNDHISDYGHRQDIVDAINRYIEELDD